MLSPEDHLERMSGILRRQIGPAVADPFARTQAFMASVVLDKLARQLSATPGHLEAERTEVATLQAVLRAELTAEDPAAVTAAVDGLDRAPAGAALSAVVAALWATRPELGPERAEHLLGLIRPTLRARLDRQLEYAA